MIWKTGAALAVLALANVCAEAQTANPASPTVAPTADSGTAPPPADEILVTGQAVTYATSQVTDAMIDRQPTLGSVNDVLNELPGVLVTEGDAFGSSDWATSITMRGFTTNRDTQQIGTTIDGMPNGGSGYGGGSKANRFIDVLDLETVRVSQGTADIASPSNEALGGTLDYITSDPAHQRRLRFAFAAGDYGAQKYYVRADTGEIAPNTFAWISASATRSHDWIDGSGHSRREHLSAKLRSTQGRVALTAYASYDDADESEYGSVSAAGFANNPNADGLMGNWTGIPYVDQNYRSGSRALRKNLFGYLKADVDLNEVKLSVSGYGHHMTGRGDWLPPYLVDVTNDGAGQPNSEYLGGKTVYSPKSLGMIYFVTPTGATATMIPGCTGSSGIPKEYDPSCYPAGSKAVQSYRHTHYQNDRFGFLSDVAWNHEFGDFENALRAGAWYEYDRSNSLRDWHKITDTHVGYAFDEKPYWVQFSTDQGTDEFMYYAQDMLTYGPLTARFGLKQFFLRQTNTELLEANANTRLNSHSKPLIYAGLAYATPVKGLEAFAGFSQNFSAIPGGLLDQGEKVVREIKPETADNIELGVRYGGKRIQASVTLYDIQFKNRILFVPANFVNGIDYLGEVDGIYLNVGGIHSRGVEASLAYRVTNGFTLSGSYTYNRATYLGSGNAKQDQAMGIVPGAQVFNSPRNMFVVSADYRQSMWKAGISTKYVGDRFIDTQGTSVAKSFVLTNAYAGVDLGGLMDPLRGLGLTLNVTNLTDERYLAGTDGGSAFLGAPRTITAAITLDF